MHKTVILAYCAFSFVSSSVPNITQKLQNSVDKNSTSKVTLKNVTLENIIDDDKELKKDSNSTQTGINKTTKAGKTDPNAEHPPFSRYKTQISIPILQKIHARITRSKDAVWATITLTFICILLVLAVAQSRMWKDHYYTEAQGVPLPNFNERVLFKDVMEHKVSFLKQFFKKKKSKEKKLTELESLLPTSEWDN